MSREHDGLASPYWGIQKISSFPVRILREFAEGDRYVDLTAGGGGMVFHQAMEGQPVHGNDRNAYAAAAFQTASALQDRGLSKGNYNGWYDDIHPDHLNWRDFPGYLSTTGYDDQDRFYPIGLTEEVKHYVDALCSHGPTTAYFTTRVLMDELTVRCKSWDGDSRVADDVEILFDKVAQIGQRWYDLLRSNPVGRITGTNESAENCASFVKPGDVVYTDPAWPWDPSLVIPGIADGGFDQDNPYDFLTCAAGSILKQQHIRPEAIPFWLAKNGPEHIWDDVASWVRGAFEADAHSFVLSTQGTNWPAPDLTLHEVAERAGVKLVHYEYSVATTRRSNTKFTEWFGVYNAR